MKKSFLCLTLILVLVFGVVGCGSNSPEQAVSKQTSLHNQTKTSAVAGGSAKAAPDKSAPPDKAQHEVNAAKTVGSASSLKQNAQAGLMVTSNFGRHIMFNRKIEAAGHDNILDLMKAHVKVETAYDGSFISSINGLETQSSAIGGSRKDWFYFVNGICSNVGVLDYQLHAGDIIWWDYHSWQMGPANAAVIGCYPEPFVHGYNGKTPGTVIMSTAGCQTLAANMQSSIKNQGGANINLCELNNDAITNRHGPTIIIGEWDQLKNVSYLENLNQAYRKNGMYIHFNGSCLELLDINGNVRKSLQGSAGVIAAASEGLGNGRPLWLITGTDQEGVKMAADLLINNPGRITAMYSAAVTAGELIRLPLE